MGKISFLNLQQYLNENNSYIEATLKYIDEVLGIEIDELKISDLPQEWIQCIEQEANKKKLLKHNEGKISFLSLFNKK